MSDKIFQYTENYQIEYEELARSYGEAASSNNQVRFRILACDWDDREMFQEDMVGIAKNVAGVFGRNPPNKHSSFYDDYYCVSCELVDVEGPNDQDATNDGIVEFDKAVFKCRYERLLYRVAADSDVATELDRFVIRKWDYASEMQKIPGIGFYYTDIPGPLNTVDEVPAIPWGYVQLEYIWKQVPVLLAPAISSYQNCMNSVAFDGGLKWTGIQAPTFDPKTVLFLTAKTVEYYQVDGEPVRDIVYSMLFRKQPWDQVLAADGNWHPIAKKSDNTPPFQSKDLNQLFVPTL